MSKFFRGGEESSSESDSADEVSINGSEESSDDEQQVKKPQNKFLAGNDDSDDDSDESEEESEEESDSSDDDAGKGGAGYFLKDASSESEDSDDDKRSAVKSAKDKRAEELDASIKQIENGQKNGDWTLISAEFDKLSRQVERLQGPRGKAPKTWIRTIAELEDFMNEALAKAKVTPKKMNATQARALNAMKQKIKKTNKGYQKDIDAYRADKDDFMESSEEEAPAPAPTKVKIPKSSDPIAQPTEEDMEGFTEVTQGGRTVKYTPESILKHLRAILDTRGKKNTDRSEQIGVLEKLHATANTPYQQIRVLLTLISSRFDLASGSSGAMPVEHWKSAEKELSTLFNILEQNKEYVVVENAEEWEDDEKVPVLQPGEKHIKVAGSLVSFVERLDDELGRSLQSIDPHTSEYIERLQDEGSLYNIIFRGLLYTESLRKEDDLDVSQDTVNRIVMRRLEHVYFKPSQVIKVFEDNCWKAVGSDVESDITGRAASADATNLVGTLCNYLFVHSDGIIRARAMLCQVYFLALHNEYYKARDMMLMSHLQENIPNFDVQSQILYNRTLVQVGLCAFRKGLVYDAQNTLQEICGSGRQKELLAQGVMMQRFNQVSPEQERLEKSRQLPFHMHINLELLECVYLTCSMLLEIPLLAQTGSSPDVKKRVISKTYRRMLEYHERQIFTGPPENTRDHVMQASKALAAGEWKKSTTFIHNIKIWDLMANTEDIKTMLSKQIQEEGLRTYLFTYAPFYDTLSVETLGTMFELEPTKVSAIISKMISHEELSASLDQVTSNVIFRKGVELSRLQSLALALSDKASSLIETNERTLEQRTQGSSNAFDRPGRGRGGGRGGARGRGGGGRGGGNTQRQAGGTQFTGGALGAAVRG